MPLRELLKQVRPSGDNGVDRCAWAKREKELATGDVLGPFSVQDVDLNSIALHLCFPVWERAVDGGWKARSIENLKRSGGNSTVETFESCMPHELDTARAFIRFERQAWGPEVELSGFTSDCSGAFRQRPLHPDQVPYMWSATWHPEWQSPALLKTLGQAFGGAGSQLNCVRDPAAMCTIMQVMFAVCMFHYCEDAWTF